VRPVNQTTYGPIYGNCISACVASILEIPIETVPFFVDANWWPRFLGWLDGYGLAATEIEAGLPAPGFTIAFGPSTRLPNRGHACVALDGAIVHDPHPSREGLPLVACYVALHGSNGQVMWFNGA
jgi:hypothetical protein